MDNFVILKAANYYANCMISIAKIRKLPNGKYKILSKDNKSLGIFTSKEKAQKRLNQIEYFKKFDHSDADDNFVIDLTDLEELTFSAFMRKLRKATSEDKVHYFLKLFKKEMDLAIKNKIQKPEKVALQNSLIKYNKRYKIRLKKEILKNASISELGNANQIAKYLASIIKLTISRISKESRPKAIAKLVEKFKNIDIVDISSKNLPNSAAIGQSISFVKNILFNHDASFVSNVLKDLISILNSDVNFADINNADIVSNQREYRNDNKDSYLNEANRSSIAPYMDPSRTYPDQNVHKPLSSQYSTRENYDQELKMSDDKIIMPNVGLYDNSGPMKGIGPVESPGGFIHL